MTRKMGVRWHLREVMATRGMFSTTDLIGPLAERGVELSREQVYRLVTQQPERLNVYTLAALCDVLECGVGDLIEPVAERRAAAQGRRFAGGAGDQEGAGGTATRSGRGSSTRTSRPARERHEADCADDDRAGPRREHGAGDRPCRRDSRRYPPHVDGIVARAAIMRVTSRTESRNMITNYLAAHPTALVDGGLGRARSARAADRGPDRERCRRAGAAAVFGLRRGETACAACGWWSGLQPLPVRRRPLESARSAAGSRVARNAMRTASRSAGAAISSPTFRGPTLRRVRREPHLQDEEADLPRMRRAAAHQLRACGLPAAIPTDGTEPQCSHCATGTTEPCRECGELTAGRDRKGRPRCERCYQRPVGTCGRCGRVRAIVRLAVDGDPDLCAICWTGPTARCENCGKVRPCRGERRGRMLCGTCAPVRPQTCAHCGQSRRPTAHWPEGPVCRACYDRALDAKATCPQCGEQRRLMRYPGAIWCPSAAIAPASRRTTCAGAAAMSTRPTSAGCARAA